MKLERVSENQISCVISGKELEAKQIKLTELAYGSDKARMLFGEIMRKANIELGFEVANKPLMIEAIPTSNQLKLTITRVDSPEALDSRFSNFTLGGAPENDDDMSDFDDDDMPFAGFDETDNDVEGLVGATADKNFFGSTVGKLLDSIRQLETAYKNTSEGNPTEAELVNIDRYFEFESIENVIDASKLCGSMFYGYSRLYRDKAKGIYILNLHKQEMSNIDFMRCCNLLGEYANVLAPSASFKNYCEESMQTIIPDMAIEKLASM